MAERPLLKLLLQQLIKMLLEALGVAVPSLLAKTEAKIQENKEKLLS
jgi:hypothetical protein